MDFTSLFEKTVHPDIERFARYCLELAAGRNLPRKDDFLPEQAMSLLGNLYLLKKTPSSDYVPEVFGVRMAVLYDCDMTDIRLGAFENTDLRQELRRSYDMVVEMGAPVYQRGRYVWSDKTVGFERLMVPLTDNDGKIAALLCSTSLDVSDEELETFRGAVPSKLIPEETMVIEPRHAIVR